MTCTDNKPVANPLIILREEFDDWGILFNPDNGRSFGINPVSVFIWKLLDGKHTIPDIVSELRRVCDDVPDDAENYVEKFIKQLLESGMAGYEVTGA